MNDWDKLSDLVRQSGDNNRLDEERKQTEALKKTQRAAESSQKHQEQAARNTTEQLRIQRDQAAAEDSERKRKRQEFELIKKLRKQMIEIGTELDELEPRFK